jgi:hypothetical protein
VVEILTMAAAAPAAASTLQPFNVSTRAKRNVFVGEVRVMLAKMQRLWEDP